MDIFAAKQPKLFWRGTTTGRVDGGTVDGLAQNHRVRACLFAQQALGARGDVKVSRLHGVRPELVADAQRYLDAHGIGAPPAPEAAFGEYQAYLDLPGNSAAWGTYRKYLMGCLVVRPASDRELLYYQFQKPWLHFIPAAPDLSDLPSVMEWVTAHPADAAAIAYNGRRAMIDYLSAGRDHVRTALQAALQHDIPLPAISPPSHAPSG